MSSSNLSFDPLRDPSTVSSLQTLALIFETSIGPTGRLKLLENTRTLSSSSQRLISCISVKNIISKVVVSTAKNQLKSFNDGGLFCALLTLKLILPATADSSRSLPLVGTLYDIFAKDFLCLLKESSGLEVDFSNLNHLKSVVLTVLSSKPGCLLSRFDRDHICSIILKAFLDSIPTDGKSVKIVDSFRFVNIDRLPPIKSKLLKGALVQIPETDITFFKKLHQKGPIKVALFTCSLAGDADWPVENLETTSLDLVVESVMRLLDNLVSKLVFDKVNLLFCQKVVHPRMKKRLQRAGILFIDRLGIEAAKCIQYISGGNSIASLFCELSYGTVPFVSIEQLGKNNFLLLSNDTVPLFTIVLAHYNEESLAELKVVCRQALDSLLRILRLPSVCFGGGCSDILTGLCLANKVKSNIDAIKREACCTFGEVLESLSTFLRAVVSTSVAIHNGKVLDFATENTHGHLWKLHEGHFPIAGSKCLCGSCDSASIDPLSWSLLSNISNLYGFFPLMAESSEKFSVKVSPSSYVPVMKKEETKIGASTQSLTVTNFSFEVEPHSSKKEVTLSVVSSNSSPQEVLLTSNFNLSPDCFSPLNSMPSKSESDVLPSVSFSTITSSLNANKFVAQSGADTCPNLPKTVPNNSDVTQQFRKVNSPVTIPFIGPVPIPFESCSQEFQTSQASLPGPTSKSTDSVLLDELTCKTNSLSLAFETASLLLRTTVCINNLPA
ncbi:hypothetical protein JTE90_006900 [Oedothorax gibbosus]|uniref:McKusick-Kaufman syndrome n=1 Tax=Oedothorax gibbosus TaxID=931172 RepID=A0AAV6VPL7_9ARAC|nr:hypothetical protein JTE90_006900 [Oedothorax gibbosus]